MATEVADDLKVLWGVENLQLEDEEGKNVPREKLVADAATEQGWKGKAYVSFISSCGCKSVVCTESKE